MAMMLYRLVHLIETHSPALADCLMARARESDKMPAYVNVPTEELRGRVYEIYRHLGDWLMKKDKMVLEMRYSEIGARRAAQHVPLSQLIWAIILTKKTLWAFIEKEGILERPAEVLGELELSQLLEEFFDRAIYCAVMGYERTVAEHAFAQTIEARQTC
jgi:hypothetical protein